MRKYTTITTLGLLLLLLAAAGRLSNRSTHEPLPAPVAETTASTPPPAKDAPMPTAAEINQLIQRAEAASYAFQPEPETGALIAGNQAQRLHSRISPETGAVQLRSLELDQTWSLEMRTLAAAPGAPKHQDGQITLTRPGLDEWFYHDQRGLEHGYTVTERPAAAGLKLDLELRTDLTPRLLPEGRGLAFTDRQGTERLRYAGLLATDSTGRALPARLSVAAADRVSISVDDTDARYPVMIDPIFTTQTNRLTAQPQAGVEHFGGAVAVSGDILAVGVPLADRVTPAIVDSGAVDLFRFNPVSYSWTYVKRVQASVGFVNAHFGASLQLEAGRLVIGAPGDATNNIGDGAVYVFERDQGGTDNWGQVAKIIAPALQNAAFFGQSIALDGDIILVGEPNRDGAAGANQGAAYITRRAANGTWGAAQAMTGFVPNAGARLGAAVQLEGQRAIIGVPRGNLPANPSESGLVSVQDFTLDDAGLISGISTVNLTDFAPTINARFGAGLAYANGTLAVGCTQKFGATGGYEGSVQIQRYFPGLGWFFIKELFDPNPTANGNFGAILALSGDTLLVGAPAAYSTGGSPIPNVGHVRVYERNAGGADAWGCVERLLPYIGEDDAVFGSAVALNGDVLVIGAPGMDGDIPGSEAGVAFTYERRADTWRVTAAPEETGFPGNSTRKGQSVSIDRGMAAVGMPRQIYSGQERGMVQVLRSNQAGEERWAPDSSLLLSPASQANELFGQAVAIHGEWLLIGAPGYNQPAAVDTGRAYLFRRNAVGWNHYLTFEPPMLTAHADFGASVTLTERWAVIGAPGMNHVFVYDREEGGADIWDISTVIDRSAQGGRFGASITVDGNQMVIGAPSRAGVAPGGAALASAGQAEMFRSLKVAGELVWSSVKFLPAPAVDGSWGTAAGGFGTSVSLYAGMLAVGEIGIDGMRGRVNVFSINHGGAENWGLLRQITAPGAMANEQFGGSVAVGTRWILAGAPGRVTGGISQGAVLAYDRDTVHQGTEGPSGILRHPSPTVGDEFGHSLAISNDEVIAGAPGAVSSNGTASSGKFAIFHRQGYAWADLGVSMPGSAGEGDRMGTSVTADGDFVFAGAPYDTVSGQLTAGSVFMFRRSSAVDSGWLFVKKITASDPSGAAFFGQSVSVSGEVLVVGAPGWDGRGAIYIYHRNQGGGDNWGEVARRSALGIQAGDRFGASVSVHNDLVAVGVPEMTADGVNAAGIVYIFDRHQGSTDSYAIADIFHSPTPVAFGLFGTSVSISDQRVLVGEPLATLNGPASGAAYFFTRIPYGTDWAWTATLEPNDGAANDRFGTSVSLDGSTAAVGAPGKSVSATNSGAVYVFESLTMTGLTWSERRRILPGNFENPETLEEMNFGYSVALRGDQLLGGAPGRKFGAMGNVGGAWLMERNQDGSFLWGVTAEFTSETPAVNNEMGMSVALLPDLAVIGAPRVDNGGSADEGYVHFYGIVGTGYQTWASLRFGAMTASDPSLEAVIWGADADPDDDGRVNAVEAFMGTHPLQKEAGSAIAQGTRSATQGLVLRYRQGKETHGASALIRWSRDLQTWHRGELSGVDDFVIQTRVVEDHPEYLVKEAWIAADQLVGEDTLYLRLEIGTAL
jgi:hypothetical protein